MSLGSSIERPDNQGRGAQGSRLSNRCGEKADGEGEQHKAAERVDRDVYRADHLNITELVTVGSGCDLFDRTSSASGDLGSGKRGPEEFAVNRVEQGCHDRLHCLIRRNPKPPLFPEYFAGRPKWFHGSRGESACGPAPIGRHKAARNSRTRAGEARKLGDRRSDQFDCVADFRAGMLTIRIAYSLDGQEV